MYHEYVKNTTLNRTRGGGHLRGGVTIVQGDDLIAAKTKLAAILGRQGFYDWACTIPDHVIMDEPAYVRAINEELALYADYCQCQLPGESCDACRRAATNHLEDDEIPY